MQYYYFTLGLYFSSILTELMHPRVFYYALYIIILVHHLEDFHVIATGVGSRNLVGPSAVVGI